MITRVIAALVGVTLVVVAAACGGTGSESPTPEQRSYVADACEPFANYMEGLIATGFPGSGDVTTPEDALTTMLDLTAVSQTALREFSRIEPPPDIRDVHEQILAVLETEIAGLDALSAALRSRDEELLNQALKDTDQMANLAGIGPTGFFPTDVPAGYEEAWNKDCAPRLRQIEDGAS